MGLSFKGLKKTAVSCCLAGAILLMGVSEVSAQLTSVIALSQTARLHAYQYETLADEAESKIDSRTPLILIHGIGGRESASFKWDNFLEYAEQHPEFRERFRVYLFEYDTSRSVPEISTAIRDTLRTFLAENNYPKFRVLAFSEGGLVYRNAMQDPIIFRHTDKVVTVASPFHGSPLANEDWLSSQLKDKRISLMTLTHKLSYAIVEMKHPSFREDFHWQELDDTGSQPQKQYALESHHNFIAYGSYFGVNNRQHEQLFRELEIRQSAPDEDRKLRNFFNKHLVFDLVQNALTRIAEVNMKLALKARQMLPIPGTSDENTDATAIAGGAANIENSAQPLGMITPLLLYNDGISPISSSLWLGRYTSRFTMLPDTGDRDWAALRSLKGKHKARLFHSMDHANWMDGRNRSSEARLHDLLNPQEPPKTVFEWYMHDLTS